MDRIYRVIAIRRDGVWQYWEPVLSQFTFKEIPTNRYYKYTEALREYRRAIDKASPNETLSIFLEEKIGHDGTWYALKERQFTQNERSTKTIWDDMNSMRIDMGCLSSRIGSITGLSSLSKETKEELTLMSKQLDSLSFLANKLQCKILEELDNVQDTEN
nr:MAG TPA: hypothetical protein [Caudoviricetes sp.]